MKKILQLILPLLLLFLVASCGSQGNVQLSYSDTTIDMNVGETINVKPTVTGDNATLKYSLSSNIATIDNDGNLTAVAAGQLVLTVTADEDATAKAKLIITIKDNSSYTISFDVNGGDPLNDPIIVFTDASSVDLPTPTKDGYKFLGWSLESGSTSYIEAISTTQTGDVTVYANWEKEEVPVVGNPFEITYELNGGAWSWTTATVSDAASGIDALIHSLEAYVSVMASDFTDGLALQAIKLVFEYLPRCYENGQTDYEAREKMANAATISGIAFANAFLGVCHSLAHKLGAFHHIPHGIANALVIEDVV